MNNWVKYSSLGLELAIILGGCVFLGVKIDHWRGGVFPLFTLLGSLLGFIMILLRLLYIK